MKNKSVLQSFKNAWYGLCQAFKSERNMKVHFIAAILVIAAGLFLEVDNVSWIALIFAIGLVFIAELFNTAIEELTDLVIEEFSEKAGRVKDISASAVMASACVAVAIGIRVFLPQIIEIIKQISK